jgi:hypothetical protein
VIEEDVLMGSLDGKTNASLVAMMEIIPDLLIFFPGEIGLISLTMACQKHRIFGKLIRILLEVSIKVGFF